MTHRLAAVTTSETIVAYSEANQHRIFDACAHATAVRTVHGWLAAGRVVLKGQKGHPAGRPRHHRRQWHGPPHHVGLRV